FKKMAAQNLMKRGKRNVATYIKAECAQKSGQQQLTTLLDYLLDPQMSLDDFDKIDWLKSLIAGGSTFEEFGKTVRMYDNATTCGLVWTSNFVAYRCRTCGISPCMSLCADCFQAGDHEGHDFNMFRSQAGGACDCGDVGVMNANGFCSRHGPHHTPRNVVVPPDLLLVAEAMMPRLLLRLVQHLRDHAKPDMLDTYLVAMQEIELYLGFLGSLVDMGAAMRTIITLAFTNPNTYKSLAFTTDISNTSDVYGVRSRANYLGALVTLKTPHNLEEFKDVKGIGSDLQHNTFLEEMVFWTVKFEFPQKIITLLLSMLPDDVYKSAFTMAFVYHYSRASISLVNSVDRQTISNRVVHVSVQLLSPEHLAWNMVEEHQLLEIMLVSLHHLLGNVLVQGTVLDTGQRGYKVVDCEKDVMKDHCYWPIVSDLINILSHKAIAIKFMTNTRLVELWFKILTFFQAMNMNQRELNQHVQYEPDVYYSSFSAELEICSSPMWHMLVHCKQQDSVPWVRKVLSTAIHALVHWADSIGVKPDSKLNPNKMSFHLPLHRYLSVFLVHAVRNLGLDLDDLLPLGDHLKIMMKHPLDTQVAVYGIFAGLWVRNGLQMKGQAMTYLQCHFCNSMIDADLYLLQVCAAKLDPDYFITTLLERFHVTESLSFSPIPPKAFLSPDQLMSMLEGALHFLATIITIRTNLGMSDEEITRQEMTSLLCVNNRTHSQLMDMIPEKCGYTGQNKEFEPILNQVSDYEAPKFEPGGAMQQGMYVPKRYIWDKDYDPMYVSMRCVRRDAQGALDRYTTLLRHSGEWESSTSLWPPFKVPGDVLPTYVTIRQLLHCSTLHAVVFAVLHKALNDPKVPEPILSICVYLLELALSIPNPTQSTAQADSSPSEQSEVEDMQFSTWYPSGDITHNLRHTISSIKVTETANPFGDVKERQARPHGVLAHDMETVEVLADMFQLAPSTITAIPNLFTSTTDAPSTSETGDDSPPQVEHKGVSTDDTEIQPTIIAVNETIISLLIKLHSKLSGNPGSYQYRPDKPCAKFGDGPIVIARVLDTIGDADTENARIIKDLCHQLTPEPAAAEKHKGKKVGLSKEERRKRAKEVQQKLMAQFASIQKAFMEQSMDIEGTAEDTDAGTSVDAPTVDSPIELEVEEAETMYDCSICGQTTPSTLERPISLVVLLQSSSVLGSRKYTGGRDTVPTKAGGCNLTTTCAEINKERLQRLLKHFDVTSALASVNIGWEGGIVAQTCGHYLHLDCHESYIQSLRTEPQHVIYNLEVTKGEYWCPVCRQLSNTVLPILPDIDEMYDQETPGEDLGTKVAQIGEIIQSRPITPGSGALTQVMSNVMDDLSNATYPQYKSYITTYTSSTMLLFVCSMARTNLELDLEYRGGTLCRDTPINKKRCLVPLIHVLSMHSKLLSTTPYIEMWNIITGNTHPTDDSSMEVEVYMNEVPLLLRDLTSQLIHLVLTMPPGVKKPYYQCIVQAVYNVLYVQAVAIVTTQFTEDERDAWKSKQTSHRNTSGVVSQVINLLAASKIYASGDGANIPVICQSVWSPQSVESSIQEHSLAFLQLAALLQQHLYDDQLPTIMDKSEEYPLLCKYLGLCSESSPISNFESSMCVHWLCPNPDDVIKMWCRQMAAVMTQDDQTAEIKKVLLTPKLWQEPLLCQLPRKYDVLFQHYRHAACATCNNVSKEPALCLLCGRLVCFKQKCCVVGRKHEAVQHSIECGAGTALYLIINTSFIVVVRGTRAALWGSIYLDDHGEEDRDLKRGKPLHLSEERFQLLEKQWRTHTFHHIVKRWIWHKDGF
ncbi:unnamed protein product, partial [Owenia fusiformis]